MSKIGRHWKLLPKYKCICKNCGNEFLAKFKTKVKWCSQRCKHIVNAKPNLQKYNLKSNFDLTIEQYQELLKQQNYVCDICKKVEVNKDRFGNIRNLSVDHDHKTGKIRGLLCGNCNTAIGMFNESIFCLDSAKNYLEKYK